MKQLKFMLAAATAVGIAAAAQAGVNTVKTIDNENFEADSFVADTAATNYPGYSFAGENPADDESVIKAGGYNSTKALQVNTGTDPLLRALKQTSATAQKLDLVDFSGVNIDTMVQFTVTPAGDKVTATAGDKLMIYLAEATNDVGDVTGTNLVVKAAAYEDGAFVEGGRSYVTVPFEEVVPNSWYRLVVKARAVRLSEEGGYWPLFQVYLGGDTDDYRLITNDESGLDNINEDIEFTCNFLSLQIQSEDGEAEDADTLNLQYVGFAGEGMVDDLTVSTLKEVNSLDFTLALDANVSAVIWTVNDEVQDSYEFSTEDPSVTALKVVINSVTYKPGYAGVKDWTGWTTTVTESDKISIESTKFADVSGDVVTPTDDTITAAANGAFACPAQNAEGYAVAVEKLGKAVTWATSVAKKSYNDAMTFINEMNFVNVTTNNVDEAAYLFNCAPTPEAVAIEAAAFTFPSFTKDMTLDDMKAAIEEGKSYNGTVEIHGATTLEKGGDWAKDKQGAFYKAVLTK